MGRQKWVMKMPDANCEHSSDIWRRKLSSAVMNNVCDGRKHIKPTGFQSASVVYVESLRRYRNVSWLPNDVPSSTRSSSNLSMCGMRACLKLMTETCFKRATNSCSHSSEQSENTHSIEQRYLAGANGYCRTILEKSEEHKDKFLPLRVLRVWRTSDDEQTRLYDPQMREDVVRINMGILDRWRHARPHTTHCLEVFPGLLLGGGL